MTPSDIVSLLIAALGGAAVGLERQWSGHADGPEARFAGIRTFTMLGAVGGFGGWLWTAGVTAPATLLVAGGVAIVAIAYLAASRQDVDGTTEVAALVVLAAGVIAGLGSIRLASAIIALVTLLLVEKSRLHALVRRIDDVGLRSGVRFAVMALVILPLLPAGPYGPLGGVRPRELWALVLFFSGLSFAGYVARRLVGPGHGYFVTGLLGGMVSSTNVTFTFARASRIDSAMDRALGFGAVAANAMLYPRVIVATSILNAAVVPPLIFYLVPPAAIAGLIAVAGAIQSAPAEEEPPVSIVNPLQLAGALQMAVLFQAVLMAVYLAREWGGASGIFTSAAILGLTDVDALTMSMARGVAQTDSPAIAAAAIAVGVLANTTLKLGLVLFLGRRRFRVIAGGALAGTLLALGATLAVNHDSVELEARTATMTSPSAGILTPQASPFTRSAGPTPWTRRTSGPSRSRRTGAAPATARSSTGRGIQARGEVRHQFHHVIDVAATVLDVAGLPEPTMVNGVLQEPLHGVSMRYSFDDATAADRHEMQYFEMFCNRGIYHKGWTAVTRHGNVRGRWSDRRARSTRTSGSSTTRTPTGARPTISPPLSPGSSPS